MMEEMEGRQFFDITGVDIALVTNQNDSVEGATIQISLTPHGTTGDTPASYNLHWFAGSTDGFYPSQLSDYTTGINVPDSGDGAADAYTLDGSSTQIHSYNGTDSHGSYTMFPVWVKATSTLNAGPGDWEGTAFIKAYDVPTAVTVTHDEDAWVGETYTMHLSSYDPAGEDAITAYVIDWGDGSGTDGPDGGPGQLINGDNCDVYHVYASDLGEVPAPIKVHPITNKGVLNQVAVTQPVQYPYRVTLDTGA